MQGFVAERGCAAQPAEISPRVFPIGPPHCYSLILVFPGCTGTPVVLPDVAGVVRLHFGSLSPARRALQVPLVLFLLHEIHSNLAFS